MTPWLRMAFWFLFGSTGIFMLAATTVAILVMRGTVCRELTYDGGDICLGNADKSLWFDSRAAFWAAIAAWMSSSLIIPILVAYKTRWPGWAIVAFLLVVTASIVGDLAARFWIRREYPGMDWPHHGSDSIALLSLFIALFVTFIGSAVTVELSREQAEHQARGAR